MRTLAATLVVVAVAAGPWCRLQGQWAIAADIGVARFGGTSRDSAGATVGPYRPTTFGLRLERDLGRARVAVGVLHAETGLVAEGQGAAVDLWNFDGEQRNRVGGRAAAVLEWPLARALMGSLRVSGVVSESVFDAADAPGGVERRATRRFGVAVGLRYQL